MNAIVTGGTRGIGRAIVMHLAANKYNVALCARDEKGLSDLLEELRGRYSNQRFLGLTADLSQIAEVSAFAEAAAREFGCPDVIVNNAGLYLEGNLLNEEPGVLEKQFAVNVVAPYTICRYFGMAMKQRGGGHIFNICSVASIEPVSRAASYSMSKAALLSMTHLLRAEMSAAGVHVTAVMPGATLTSSWDGVDVDKNKFVLPDDIAESIISCLKMSPGANVDEIRVRPVRIS